MKTTLSGIERRLANLEATARETRPNPTREAILLICLDSRLSNEQAAKQIGAIGGRTVVAGVARIREIFALARARKQLHETNS